MINRDLNVTTLVIAEITDEMIRDYANVSQDDNPIHLDKDKALIAGFPDRIVHGMLTMAMCSRLYTPWLNEHFFVSEWRTVFRRPLLVGDSLHIYGEMIEQNNHNLIISISGQSGNGELVVEGEVELRRRWKDGF